MVLLQTHTPVGVAPFLQANGRREHSLFFTSCVSQYGVRLHPLGCQVKSSLHHVPFYSQTGRDLMAASEKQLADQGRQEWKKNDMDYRVEGISSELLQLRFFSLSTARQLYRKAQKKFSAL